MPERTEDPEQVVQIDLSADSDDLAALLEELDIDQADADPADEVAELRAKLERLEREASAEQGLASGGATEPDVANWITEENT
ncbi:hypothetical protein [Actinoallomurus sp. CA-150999]|uniref:hypothetical protein n=1 Tax=Actinoallomurus sp. CA-150999 TaxID=3239887 RepID=UPI003D8B7597